MLLTEEQPRVQRHCIHLNVIDSLALFSAMDASTYLTLSEVSLLRCPMRLKQASLQKHMNRKQVQPQMNQCAHPQTVHD